MFNLPLNTVTFPMANLASIGQIISPARTATRIYYPVWSVPWYQ